MNPARRSTGPAGDSGQRWLPLLALAVGLIGIALPQSDFFRAIPGDLGDARFNGLILEHVFRWVRGIDASLWSPGFFYPFPGTLAFSDNHLGTVGVYMLLRVAGWTPELAYIGWFTAAYVANYLCCYHAFRQFGLSSRGGAVGAFIFAFAMPVLVQASHAQLGYRFAVPLALLALHRLISDGRPAHLAWLAIWVTVQFYASIYLGYFLLLLLGSYVVAALMVPPAPLPLKRPHRVVADLLQAPRNAAFWGGVGTLAGCGVALFALFHPYAHYSHLYGFVRHPAEIESMLPRLGSYLLADQSALWGRFSQRIAGIPMRHEQQMFFGAAACLLAAVGVARAASAWIRASAVALLLLVLLTLDVHGFSLYSLLERLPMANAIRAVSRICLVMLFPLALLAGAGFDRLTAGAGLRRPVQPILAGALVALLVGEYATLPTGRVPLAVWRDRLTALVAEVPPRLPPAAILFVPRQPNVPFYLTELDGMSLAQRLNRNTINGYSGNSPPGFGVSADPCEDLVDRLAGYVEFMKLDAAHLDALAKDVVPVGAALDCPMPRSLPPRTHFRGALPDAMFRQIALHIADLSVTDARQLALDLVVDNRANTALAAVSDSHTPIRFSWRFVPADARVSGAAEWNTRIDLSRDVPPRRSERFRLRLDPPQAQGRYRLEVSMVQEGVAWFHDKGLTIARSAEVIEVGHGGSVVIGP